MTEEVARPAKVTHTPVVVKDRQKLTDPGVLDRISAKHIIRMKDRPNACCQDVENMEVEYLKTNPDLKQPDMMIMHCTDCGAKHRVIVGQTGQHG